MMRLIIDSNRSGYVSKFGKTNQSIASIMIHHHNVKPCDLVVEFYIENYIRLLHSQFEVGTQKKYYSALLSYFQLDLSL